MQNQPIEIKTEPNAVGSLPQLQGGPQPTPQLTEDLASSSIGAEPQALTVQESNPVKTDPISPAQKHAAQVLLVVGIAMLMIVTFRLLKKNARNQKRHKQADRPLPAQAAPSQAISSATTASRNRIEQLMSDAEELTRRLAAHMDNKAAHLETLLTQTEARIAELESLLAHARSMPPSDSHAQGGVDLQAGYARSAGQMDGNQSHAQAGTDAQLLAAQEPALDPFHRRVYALADQGQSSIDIARQLDRPTGQIELVLALRKK